jgi:hypothetical protein
VITCFFLLITSGQTAFAEENLAKQSQNPLGTIISAPFENNFNFGIGPSDATAYVLNMKPVYPVNLGDWNLINRFILPVIYSEGRMSRFLRARVLIQVMPASSNLPREARLVLKT